MPSKSCLVAFTILSAAACSTPEDDSAGATLAASDSSTDTPPGASTPAGASAVSPPPSAPATTIPSPPNGTSTVENTGGDGPRPGGGGISPTPETSGGGGAGAGGSSPSPNAAPCGERCIDDCVAAQGRVVEGTCSENRICCVLPPEQNGGAGSGGTAGTGAGGDGGTSTNAGGSGGTGPAPAEPSYDYAADVENTSADCEVAALPDASGLPTITKLPDPFTKLDGTRMASKSEWRCRRQEIIEQAKKYVYGDKPTPDVVTGTVSDSAIDVHVEAMGTAIDFTARIALPSGGEAPYPAIINVGSGGISLGESRILAQGVAIIYYNHGDLGTEGAPEASRGLPNPGKFYDIYGGDHSAGLLMSWAWGASRIIDVLQQSDNSVIDVGSLGVTGCSRNGKGAFTIGVFDERIALTIPHETSTAGVPVYRLVDILNTERTDHNYFGLNWFSNNFEPFVYANGTSNVVKLPIDTHELVALVAPRGLLVLDNPHQTQMSAPAGHLATVVGAEIYKALGVEDHVSYHSSVAQTPHCSYKDEYTDLLERNIARFLKHEDAETGDFIVGQGGDGEPGDWVEWETPVLAE